MDGPSLQEHSFPSHHYQLALEYPITTSLSSSLPEVIEVPEVDQPPDQPIEVISIYPATAVDDKTYKTKNGHGTIFHHNANGDLSMSSIETSPKRVNGDISKESSPKKDSLTSKDSSSPKRESRAKLFSRSIQKSFSTFGLYTKRKHESNKKDFKEFIPMQETHSKPMLNNVNALCNGSIQKPPADGHRTPSRSSSPQPGPSGNGNVRNPLKPKRGSRGRYELVGNRCNSPEVEKCEITVEPTEVEQPDGHNGRLIPNEKEQASLREAADRGTKFIAVIVLVLFITLVVLLLHFA